MTMWNNASPERSEWASKAHAVRLEDELARRGFPFWTKPRHSNIGAPCPACGGTDRFSVNVKKQVFFCRGCNAAGDVINLVQALDGVGYLDAIKTLAGEARKEQIAVFTSNSRQLQSNLMKSAQIAPKTWPWPCGAQPSPHFKGEYAG
jgi:phage/plasmid primase-like uncharacterized protein